MARIAFVLLCHKDAEAVARQVGHLTAAGDRVAVHFDGRAPQAEYARLRTALKGDPGVVFAARRVKCAWGGWSLVQATLEALRAALRAFPEATHFYMISGDCAPIKTAEHAHAFLEKSAADHIESVDFHTSGWIKTGMREERLIYRHVFNERSHKRLFYASLELQKRLGLRRAPPADLEMMIGSQWWCLRRSTVEKVMDFCARRRDVMRFFRTTWIPDETFFQTLVRHLVPGTEIRARPPTFLMFTDYGMPAVFYNDHHDLLLAQDYLFARKISPDAHDLKARLGALYARRGVRFEISDEGRSVFAFLTGRGRIGRRFAPRFWEAGATLGRRRELLLLVCHNRTVGATLARAIADALGLPGLGYVFDDEAAALPALGGIETGLYKRARHRRALMRMLYDHHGTDRLLICVDPGNFDVIRDFASDSTTTRILAVEGALSDAYLARVAIARGLAGPQTPPSVMARLVPPLRRAARDETDRLREAGFDHLDVLCDIGAEAGADAAGARALAAFARLSETEATRIIAHVSATLKESAHARDI
jgi:hypothetical protein